MLLVPLQMSSLLLSSKLLLHLLLSPHQLLLLVYLVMLCRYGGFARRYDHIEMFLSLFSLLYLLLLLLMLVALKRFIQIVLSGLL